MLLKYKKPLFYSQRITKGLFGLGLMLGGVLISNIIEEQLINNKQQIKVKEQEKKELTKKLNTIYKESEHDYKIRVNNTFKFIIKKRNDFTISFCKYDPNNENKENTINPLWIKLNYMQSDNYILLDNINDMITIIENYYNQNSNIKDYILLNLKRKYLLTKELYLIDNIMTALNCYQFKSYLKDNNYNMINLDNSINNINKNILSKLLELSYYFCDKFNCK